MQTILNNQIKNSALIRRESLKQLRDFGILGLGGFLKLSYTPNVALFNENESNATITLKEILRHFMNNKVNLIGIGEKGKDIVKEVYVKLWCYLDMGKNDEIES